MALTQSRPGDWDCPSCGELCFASRYSCFKCGANKPGPASGPKSNQDYPPAQGGSGVVKPGDWSCPKCYENCFAWKTSCYKCGYEKASSGYAGKGSSFKGGGGASLGMYNSSKGNSYGNDTHSINSSKGGKPGDWTCPFCKEMCFGSKSECYKCGTSRYGASGSEYSTGKGTGYKGSGQKGSSGKSRPGDWDCPSCGKMNFAFRDHCLDCQEMKPVTGSSFKGGMSEKGKAGKGKGQSVRVGDWICAGCAEHIFGSKDSCWKCLTTKKQTMEALLVNTDDRSRSRSRSS